MEFWRNIPSYPNPIPIDSNSRIYFQQVWSCMSIFKLQTGDMNWKQDFSLPILYVKCLDNKWAVRLLSDSLKIVILTPEVEWLCTTQLGFTSNKLTQPLKSHFVTSYLLFNALVFLYNLLLWMHYMLSYQNWVWYETQPKSK